MASCADGDAKTYRTACASKFAESPSIHVTRVDAADAREAGLRAMTSSLCTGTCRTMGTRGWCTVCKGACT